MRTLAMILLSLAPLVAVSGLTVLYTMQEANVETVRGALLFKVWGICIVFAVPFGFVLAIIANG